MKIIFKNSDLVIRLHIAFTITLISNYIRR